MKNLLEAVRGGEISAVNRVMDSGEAELDEPGRDGDAPLHIAVKGDHFEIVAVLLEAGADPDVQDAGGGTALLHASLGQLDLVELLLEHGADPNLPDDDGATPLFHAASVGAGAIVHALVAAGGDAVAVLESHEEALSEKGRALLASVVQS